jgi:hypothetical protein
MTGGSISVSYHVILARIMHHASRFYAPGRRTHAVDPSVWIGLRQLGIDDLSLAGVSVSK